MTVPGTKTVNVGDKITASDYDTYTRDAIAFLLAPPRCLAYQGTATTTFTTGVFAVLGLDTELFDSEAIHSTVTNPSRMTIVTPGLYLCLGAVSFAANATGFRESAISKNGTISARGIVQAASAGTTVVPVHTYLQCVAGDYIELQGAQSSGGNLASTLGVDSTWLSVLRVSA